MPILTRRFPARWMDPPYSDAVQAGYDDEGPHVATITVVIIGRIGGHQISGSGPTNAASEPERDLLRDAVSRGISPQAFVARLSTLRDEVAGCLTEVGS